MLRNKRSIAWILALGLWAVVVIGLWQHQAILDWWTLSHYHPSSAILQIAADDGLSAEGKRLLYLGQAEIDSKTTFNSHCPNSEPEQTLVLGCFTHDHIYVLEVDQPQLTQVMNVTAVHEMLHNAYARLSSIKRQQVDDWINAYYRNLNNADINQQVAAYQESEPGELLNELHSVLPTQIATLSPELEAYYSQYFTNRGQVVAHFNTYESVFKNIDSERAQLMTNLASQKSQIDSLEAQYKTAAADADQLTKEINALRAQGKTQESNQLVTAQNAAVHLANSVANQLKSLISVYNTGVNSVNQLALEETDLTQSLDSTQFSNR